MEPVLKITDRMVTAAAKAAYFEMNSITHDYDLAWREENKLRGNVWRDVARAALKAAAQYEPVT
jgi:hypothetical protein